MFGHDNDDQKQQDNGQPADNSPMISPLPDGSLDNSNSHAHDDNGAAPSAPSVEETATSFQATPVAGNDDGAAVSASDDDLLDIKQQALQQLSPLVDHLDQTPEEKFKTTMMMIQASDDKSMVKTAYAAAKDISDEKTRAQALLDVINEINYFTHPPQE